MENMIPKIIYLQIGDEVDLSFVDFKDLHKDAITWCEDKINVNDIEYINKEYLDQQNKQLLDEIEELKRRVIYWNEFHNEVIKDNVNLQSELKAADSVNEQKSKKIIEIINDSKLDKDAVIKVIVSYLTNQNK